MKTIMRGFQITALLIGIGGIISMFYHGSLVPAIFVCGAWVIHSRATAELRNIE